MGKVAVIYAGKYGTTKQYAQWICEETGGDLLQAKACSAQMLQAYDCIVFGGAVHAGRILCIDRFKKWYPEIAEKKVAVFVVGLHVEDETQQQELRELNFLKAESSFKMLFRKTAGSTRNLSEMETAISSLPCWFFPGAYDPAKVSGTDKMMMGMVKKMLEGKAADALQASDRKLLAAIENGADFTERSQIAPLADWILHAEK